MPRGRTLFSGKSKSTSETPESDIESVSRVSVATANGRVGAATLPRDPDANQQRRHSLRHSLGRTLSSIFSNSPKQPPQAQTTPQQQQVQQYLEQQQQVQQQQQIQILLEQQHLQQQQLHMYLEQQQQQQQQILTYLQEQQRKHSPKSPQQPELLVYDDRQHEEDLDAAYEQPNSTAAAAAELQQKQVERQRLQQRLAQQQQQLQQLAHRAATQQHDSPPQTPPSRPRPPVLQHQASEPLQPRQYAARPQRSESQRVQTPPTRRLQLQHQQRLPEAADAPQWSDTRPGLRRLAPPRPPQRQFSSTSGESDTRLSRTRAQEAPAIRLRRSKNSEPRPQSCSRASSRSEASSGGPAPARSCSNIKHDAASNGDMPKIRYSSTFIRKSVGDDLSVVSPTSDSAFVICDIPDGEDPQGAGLAHFVTLRKSKKKGLHRNASTVERKEAYCPENPPPSTRPKSISLSSNNVNSCTRHQKKAPTMLMDNL